MNKIYNVELYEDKNGISELELYLKELSSKLNTKDNKVKYKKIISYIRILQEKGLLLGEPYIKKIDNEIWELRPLKDRILFSYEENTFILLNVFSKRTRKTPKREIEKAKKLLEDYKKRRK